MGNQLAREATAFPGENLVDNFGTNASGTTWWPNPKLTHVVSLGEPIVNWCRYHHRVAKFVIIISCAICWPNLQPIQVILQISILNYSSWKINSSYGLNSLGPLCPWQCLIERADTWNSGKTYSSFILSAAAAQHPEWPGSAPRLQVHARNY